MLIHLKRHCEVYLHLHPLRDVLSYRELRISGACRTGARLVGEVKDRRFYASRISPLH